MTKSLQSSTTTIPVNDPQSKRCRIDLELLLNVYNMGYDLCYSVIKQIWLVSSHETKSQVSFTDPTSSVVVRFFVGVVVVNFSLKRLHLLQFSSDFDHPWYI